MKIYKSKNNKLIIILLCFILGLSAFHILFQNHSVYSNTLGLVSKNWQNIDGERNLVNKTYEKLNNENAVQWDGVHYSNIMQHGYNAEKIGGDYIFAFFPLFPLLWKISSLPATGILFLNFALLALAILILSRIQSLSTNFINNILIYLGFPGIVIFIMPYTEATFFLMVCIGVYGFFKNKYWLYSIGFFLAAITRPSYTFLMLSILCVEFFFLLQHRNILLSIKNTFLKILPLLIGTMTVSVIHLLSGSGSLIKFIQVQKYWQNILAIPHNLRDWSHEGFAINIGVLILISFPLIVILIKLIAKQISKQDNRIFTYNNPSHYILLLSAIYIIGNTLFVIFFRGGSLHCLFRFTICSPFFLLILLIGKDYIKKISLDIKLFTFGLTSLIGLFVLGVADYSTHWNFSDFGFFILAGTILLWILQQFRTNYIYKASLAIILILNLIWTSYLFNCYISNGWIFA